MERSLVLLLAVTSAFTGNRGLVLGQSSCEQGSCYPATGDLLIGREAQLSATSTCGLERPQRFCVVSYLEKDAKCFTCDSRQPWRAGVAERSHRIENVVSSFKIPKSRRWWQAAAGQEKVSIQLDLEAEFLFTHLIMTFKTFRPRAMLIERSFDFGRTWAVYRYFAQDCGKSFPYVTKRVVRRVSDVICEQKYSSETPSTSGEVIFRVLPPSIAIPDPYSQEVQDLVKLTNLRINLTELHTLGDTHLDQGSQTNEKYYYSLYDVTIRGSCSCYGHASRCLPAHGYNRSGDSLKHMVHGMCQCKHNTKGLNCEMCQDFYNDHPWSPARPRQPNGCKMCSCNNHASQCHFDAALFQASGGVSGGVCDNCQHNTRGVNCQECQPLYFQDPNRDIRDPDICQPCDCDTVGSQTKGDCQRFSDATTGTVAGKCICKPFVTGPRCDTCSENHWNLQAENPFGCEPCTCNPHGSEPGQGCNSVTGACTCKRYATGQMCYRCHIGFYGLSADNRYGCDACECDVGGAVNPSCDQRTGQCECRPHIRGKQCRELDPGFFFANLDYYTFEAEHGRGTGNARVYIREPGVGSPSPWTGPGYMKVMEGDSIEFSVSGLPFSTYFDVVIRYESTMPEVFRDVRVAVIRPGQVSPGGPCGDFSPRDDVKSTYLRPGMSYQLVSPASCLEQGVSYTVRLDLTSYMPGNRHRAASLLIDSIVLAPNINYVPIYRGRGLPGYLRREFLKDRCDVLQLPAHKSALPEPCRRHTFSISAFLHNGAIDCNCDRIGSTGMECGHNGGQCDCRPNVVGRRCDQCAPGTHGFGPRGCSPCNCHEIGARHNFCSEQTGQCTCMENVAGPSCDLCRPGFWGFPQCRPCHCHGNADRCDSLTGECLGCRDFTEGSNCERCQPGYHGDPRLGVDKPCRPCLCPGGPASSVQHADTCSLDAGSQDVHCHCRAGYTGRSCETCIDNYYGAPSTPGGQCQPCTCNSNINPDEPASCDGATGECLKCLFHAQGFACEHCQPGYYGDATKQNCARCVCNRLGVDGTRGEDCDRINGQCPCLPNVVGKQCDRCATGHWNIASGQGCSACRCDGQGSVSQQCNQLTGLCECVPGRGGARCADCENFFFGDPFYQCLPCDCNIQGSKFGQCDRQTGQCLCQEGVAGLKCDRCARGTTGDLPNCVPCGECFDNWERVFLHMRDQTHDLVRKAKDISVSGPSSAFDDEFRQIRRGLDEVSEAVHRAAYPTRTVRDITAILAAVRTKLSDHALELNEVDEDLRTSSGRLRRDSFRVQLLKTRVDNLISLARELHTNVTNVQFQEVGGASGKIVEAAEEARAAQRLVHASASILAEAERFRRDTDTLLSSRQGTFEGQLLDNKAALDRLRSDVTRMGGDVSDINELVCGQQAAPCSALCGGGGCGRCGGVGCDGALTLSQSAVTVAQRAEQLLDSKNGSVSGVIGRMQEAKLEAHAARSLAQLAFSDATTARNQSEAARLDLEVMMQRIRHFLVDSNITGPSSVEQAARDVLALQIPQQPEHIQSLADRIGRVVSTLTGIDEVLNETAKNRTAAEQLQQQAVQVLMDAKAAHTSSQEVKSALAGASVVQARAEQVLDRARKNIISAEEDFDRMVASNEQVNSTAAETKDLLVTLTGRLDRLTMRYTALEMDTLDKAGKAADEAQRLAMGASEKAKELDVGSDGRTHKLAVQYNETHPVRALAEKLKARADNIYKFTEGKLIALKEIKDKIDRNEKRLSSIQHEVDQLNSRMTDYLSEIKRRHKDYETC